MQWLESKPVNVHQADAVLSQASPVSGTKYTVLDTTSDVRIHSIMAMVTWTVQPTPLEVHLTIDGNALTFTLANPVTATPYYANLTPGAAATAQVLAIDSITTIARAFLLEGRSVKIEVETTGGTVSNLTCRVVYGRYEGRQKETSANT